ncbi:MAG TPA: adenylate/guanylate cyclase domain-containing protein [Anaerolineae bacterium]|nr:adenylate/guanylate cyclase domain-containing protein [Anaerolineae bacterium]
MIAPTTSERKLVTVLVVDTVGSTALAATMDPEEWSGVMLGAHERMTQAVHRFGGTVAQFTGDGLIAFFGAPRTREDDAIRAVQAALEIQKTLGEYERDLINAKRVNQFQVRVGLHTGIVVVGDVGNAQFSEYLAVGDTVTLAQQIQSATVPGTVALSAATGQLVQGTFELNEEREIELPSNTRSLRIWRVGQPRTWIQPARRVEGLNTALVGREPELSRLREAIDQLKTGRGALVSLIGEAGVGKSRLIEEMRAYAQASLGSLHWFEARGMPYGSGLYSLFQQIVRASLNVTDQDSPEIIRQRLRLAAQRQGFQEPELVGEMLGLFLAIDNGSTAQPSSLQGKALQRALFAAVRSTKRALAQTRPTVFVLEDMQWADAASVQLSLHDADLVRELPVLIVAAFRPDRDAPSWRYREECLARFSDVYIEVELEPLSADDSNALLNSLLDQSTLPDPLRAMILEKSEGNPFFMEQVLRGLMESGALVQEKGVWRAADALANIIIPNSLNAILAARLDRLSEPTRRVLQAASVIGRTFSQPLLHGVVMRAGWQDIAEALDIHLGVLERQQLIISSSGEFTLQYEFKHALIQDAAYNTLLRKRRRDMHHNVLDTMQALYVDRLDEHAAELAYHAMASEDWERAYEFARRAAENAERVYARPEAIAQYQNALAAIDRLNEPDAVKQATRADIRASLAALAV